MRIDSVRSADSPASICGIGSSTAVADHVPEFAEEPLVPPPQLRLVVHNLQSFFRWNSGSVGAVCSERVVNIRQLQDARCERNFLAGNPVGIPRSIALFMVMPDNWQNSPE